VNGVSALAPHEAAACSHSALNVASAGVSAVACQVAAAWLHVAVDANVSLTIADHAAAA
jgi:hypothetical protein